MEWKNASQYAEHRKKHGLKGGSRQAVSLRIKGGYLDEALKHEGRKVLINPEKADELWPDRAGKAGAVTARREDGGDGARETTTLAKVRIERETVTTAKARLDYERAAGRLISAEQVRAEAFKAVRIMNENLRRLPAALAGQLAITNTPADCQALLAREIDYALGELQRKFLSLDVSGTDHSPGNSSTAGPDGQPMG